jgi:hypothetical protein
MDFFDFESVVPQISLRHMLLDFESMISCGAGVLSRAVSQVRLDCWVSVSRGVLRVCAAICATLF